MMCPECGAAIPPVSTSKATNDEGKVLNSMVKKASANGSKLKSLGRKRPDLQSHGMTRGGKYAKD